MNALSLLSTLGLELPNIAIGLLVVLFLFVSIVMILVVLIQRPQGGGLSGAFGSSAEGAGQTAFGAKTGDVLTTATIIIFLLFLTTAIVLNYAVKPAAGSEKRTVAADTQTPADNAPAEGSTTTPPADGTQQAQPATTPGKAPGNNNPIPVSVNLTDQNDQPSAPVERVTDPEILKLLNSGQVPAGAQPLPGQKVAPKEGEKPAEEKPAEDKPKDEKPGSESGGGESGNGG